MPELRPIRPEDMKDVCALPVNVEELFFMFPRASYPLTEPQLKDAIDSRRDSSVLVIGGEIVGFANFYEWGPEACSIGNVIIKKEFRRMGYGRVLIEKMTDVGVKKYRTKKIRISCFETNADGLNLYRSLGFRMTGEESRIDRNGNAIGLKKFESDVVESEVRLIRYAREHVRDIQRIASNINNTRNTNTPFPYPENGAEEFLKICDADWAAGNGRSYTVLFNGQVIGNCAVVHIRDGMGPVIGYMLDERFWNRGIGRRVVGRLVEICGTDLGLPRISAPVLARNAASQKILLGNGFEYERSFRAPGDDPKFPDEEMRMYVKALSAQKPA